ncbi:hypothetical protein AABB24_017008 [Solanum stoloniferum]|uniref:Cytochrome b5 heme-binding domain-containing protein n=1 Tax=Solanum stoloniferum TaxID=62892 RepID=A0ABD2TJU0_9SOLN
MGDSKKYITAEELKKHNKREDVWISVQGKVYNVTDWIKQHPGGDIPILNLAGQEATDAFIAFHPVFAVSSSLFKSLNSTFYGRELTFDSLAKFFVSYQHFTFYPIICVSRVNLFVQTLLLLFSKRKVPDRFFNILGIMVFWTWFPLLVLSLPNWTERVLFVLTSFAVTGIQHVQFCLNHFAADVYVGQPKGNDWFEKQTAGTIDIACSPQMDWFFGGLQFQLEHHLFPRLPRCQLRKISPIVQDLCKKHNLSYRSLSFFEANRWTIRTLRTAAMQARGMLWEAVNTHG